MKTSRAFLPAVIRSHSVDGSDYQPDAWFGCRSSDDAQVAPVTDTTFIERFCQLFNLQRGDKLGLSVVVPLVDERLSADDLQRGIVRSFFWPILRGELVVEIRIPVRVRPKGQDRQESASYFTVFIMPCQDCAAKPAS